MVSHPDEEMGMKIYRGVIEGNTVRLTERTEFPDGTEALVILRPVEKEAGVSELHQLRGLICIGGDALKDSEALYG